LTAGGLAIEWGTRGVVIAPHFNYRASGKRSGRVDRSLHWLYNVSDTMEGVAKS